VEARNPKALASRWLKRTARLKKHLIKGDERRGGKFSLGKIDAMNQGGF